jgi:hypothetical protein
MGSGRCDLPPCPEKGLGYAQAALCDFQHYEGRAADLEAKAQQLLARIAQALTKLQA